MPQALTTSPARILLLVCGLLVTALPSPGPAAGQWVDLQPGDSVRFVEVRTIAWQGDHGRVIRSSDHRTPLTGRVIEVQDDALRLRVDGGDVLFESSRLVDIEVWRRFSNPHQRAAGRGAILGASIAGVAALALAICNPSIGGGYGCQGPSSVGDVAMFSLKGAAIGGMVLGAVAFLIAPGSGWESADMPYVGIDPDGTAILGLRLPIFD